MAYLDGTAILITGASSGIGAGLARELVRRGARVGLLARRQERLSALAEELESSGGTAAWAAADVRETAGLHAACDRLREELAGTDIVVANAGFSRPEVPHRFRPGRALALYDVNLMGAIRTIEWALPRFLEQRSGHIVGISSLASFLGFAHFPSYCGSKAALRFHLQALRVALRGRGIAVTTICAGFVKSELTEGYDFPMPFLWPTDRAARRIADAMERRCGEVLFPWQLAVIVALLRRLPTRATERLLRFVR